MDRAGRPASVCHPAQALNTPVAGQGSARECLAVALRLGLTSFGGPMAHIGYFERCYVERRQWLSRAEFTGMVALCQMVPGPGSSQLGFLIGWRRAGWRGALAAFAGFTLPSALVMAVLGAVLGGHGAHPAIIDRVVHGFKLVAVAVLAQAIISMARSLCPDWQRASIALTVVALVLALSGPWLSLAAIGLGAVLGVVLCRAAMPAERVSLALAPWLVWAAGLTFALLMGFSVIAGGHGIVALAAIFYRSGALVFGGGHVVLPLLRNALVPAHWLDDQAFLAGYGAAQAMPGPMFTLASYLGAACAPVGGGWVTTALWSLAGTLALFLPGLLIVTCALTFWQWLGRHRRAQAALAGINAGVVGLLIAALIDPVARTALLRPADWAIALIALILLLRWRVAPVLVVAFTIVANLVA